MLQMHRYRYDSNFFPVFDDVKNHLFHSHVFSIHLFIITAGCKSDLEF